MLNFNEDRRQGFVDFKYEPYRDNWKDKKIYIKYKDFCDGGMGGWGGVGGVVIIIVTARIIDM